MDPQITVVIANWNGEAYLADCLTALSKQTFKAFEVVVVDNGSKDGSLDLLARDFSWVKVITLKENLGFARANNLGFENCSSPFIATVNNDTLPEPEWLAALHEAMEANPQVGMAASKILLGKEGEELDSVGMLLYPDGMTRQRGRGTRNKDRYEEPEEVLFPSACAALYRASMLKEIGFFDEDFVSYCEDSDLGFRARLAGWQAVLAPRARVRHLYSGTGGKYSAFKAFQVERNHHWVLWKNLPLRYVLLSPFYRSWRYLIQAFGLLSGKGSVARMAEGSSSVELASVLIRADLAAAWSFLSVFFKKRRAVWRLRKISIKEYTGLLRRHRITARELMLRD
ncbi:MAG: glycosyltransferase [Planctomycetes bacterium]|nr:glycosyltransferase [Planctomycetota bacterium]